MSSRPQRRAASNAAAKIAVVAARDGTDGDDGNGLNGDILAQALGPMGARELDEYHGWVELESNPSFFNVMLRNLGVEDVKVQEVFCLDEDTIATLPKPVLGFVLLYEWWEEDENDDKQEVPEELWFAHQTMRNGCATIAFLNILMNVGVVDLGKQLAQLKEETQSLTPELRGLLVEQNAFIRGNHNAFARRIDLLNDDLLLQNEFDEDAKSSTRKTGRKKAATRSRPKKKKTDRGNHYKAYAPIANELWELNGLQDKPLSRGEANEHTWIPLAMDCMREKMEEINQNYAGDGVPNVSVMAVCQSPFADLRKELAVNLMEMSVLDATQIVTPPEVALDGKDEAQLAEYRLTSRDLLDYEPRESFNLQIGSTLGKEEATGLWEDLANEQRRILSEYRQEKASDFTDDDRVTGRKKDYTLMTHTWVKKLAEAGVLEEVIKASESS